MMELGLEAITSGSGQKKFEEETVEEKPEVVKPALIQFDSTESIFDDVCSECPAQYASENETPQKNGILFARNYLN